MRAVVRIRFQQVSSKAHLALLATAVAHFGAMSDVPSLPPQYEALERLGGGGGGEVWRVFDHFSESEAALKVLRPEAEPNELEALVREVSALSGLEGLGVPRALAFGRAGGRAYMVRELVSGESLDRVLASGREWVEPLCAAADQLGAVHRAGLFHGDIKPANIIVGPQGGGTLVDLGLALPLRESGVLAAGLSVAYAAPELRSGGCITARSEVYALGATLAECLRVGHQRSAGATRHALQEVACRATASAPEVRFPSVEEFAAALRSAALRPAAKAARAAKVPKRGFAPTASWPIVGLELPLTRLVTELERSSVLRIAGPSGSGRTTLLRRLAWSLGVRGAHVVLLGSPASASAERVRRELLEIESAREGSVLLVDDWTESYRTSAIVSARERGAHLAVVGAEGSIFSDATVFDTPPLEPAAARELLTRFVPSASPQVVMRILVRTERRPGPLRTLLARLGPGALLSEEEVDRLAAGLHPSDVAVGDPFAALTGALDQGRFDVAGEILLSMGAEQESDPRTLAVAIAKARVALAQGDPSIAERELDAVESLAAGASEWLVARGRAHLRTGHFQAAVDLLADVRAMTPALRVDALSAKAIALAYLGLEAEALNLADEAVEASAEDVRVLAIAWASRGLVLQRAGQTLRAQKDYEHALVLAERSHDASTLATTRLNLASLARVNGDIAEELGHLEAALDLGRRSGGRLVAQQSLFNLSNLDLYLGRTSKASSAIDQLLESHASLSPGAQAQLLGLQAELAARTGDVARAVLLYQRAAEAYEALGRSADGAEARLESILMRLEAFPGDVGDATQEAPRLAEELAQARAGLGDHSEHEALASLVEASIALARGDELGCGRALERTLRQARNAGRHEWTWRALALRARVARAQGAHALARRDGQSALATLEEVAARLPRDLRDVYWSDPGRRRLRQWAESSYPALSAGLESEGALFGSTSSVGASRERLPAEERLSRIFEITRELASERDLPRLLEKVVDYAVDLIGAERGLVVLVDDDERIVAHTVRGRSSLEAERNFSKSIAERVVRNGEPLVVTHVDDDERTATAASVHQMRIQSVACVPIRGVRAGRQTIGALYLETRLRPEIRFRSELPTLLAFADQVAIAIEDARLLEENRKRAVELEVSNRELRGAKERLAEILGRRTEQLHTVRRDLRQARAHLRSQFDSHFGYAGLVGTSAAMRALYARIERIRDADVSVLITGESGVGKEVVARAIHESSARAKEPFVGVNCGAIAPTLLESELFGHERGAFTGADRSRRGVFRQAGRGTLLLDEVGEMPSKMQVGLLRVLEERVIRPLGGSDEQPVEARVLAATNRDLAEMVARGLFREDLLYRLNVVELVVPPLRERRDDIPALIDHFLGIFAARYARTRKSVERAAVRRMLEFDWPGNVRQLEHVLLGAWLLGDDVEINLEDLELPLGSRRAEAERGGPLDDGFDRAPQDSSEHRTYEKERILAALEASQWNRLKAAQTLKIPRRTFYRRLKEFGIV